MRIAVGRMILSSGTRNLRPLLCRPSHFSDSVLPHPSTPPLSRQFSMESQSVAARLNSSGFLRTQGLIAGKWTDAYDGKTIEVHNPATGEVIANVPCMGGKETNDAISSAYDAFK